MNHSGYIAIGILAVMVAAPLAASNPLQSTMCAGGAPGSGCERWIAPFCATTCNDVVTESVVGPDGARLYVAGQVVGVNGQSVEILSYDTATGVLLWSAVIGPTPVQVLVARLAASPDGSHVFVSLPLLTVGTATDSVTVAFHATSGSEAWRTAYRGNPSDKAVPRGIVVAPDSTRVYVTAASADASGDVDYATVAYDVNSGAQIWESRYHAADGKRDFPKAIAVNPSGSTVYVTGNRLYQTTTIAYAASSGVEAWRTTTPGLGIPVGIVVSPDDSAVFIAAYTGGETPSDYSTVRYSAANGQLEWAVRYDGTANADDVPQGIQISPDGDRVFVTGFTNSGVWQIGSIGGTNYDYATVAYDANSGALHWASTYDAGQADLARALVVTPDGSRVFVTGGSTNTAGIAYDAVTIGYDAVSGATTAFMKFGYGTSSRGWSIASNPAGDQIFVSGQAQVPGFVPNVKNGAALTLSYDV